MTQGLINFLILSFLSVALTCHAYANDLATSLKILDSAIEISIHKSPQGPTLKLARFNNPIKSVVLKQEEQETALAIHPYTTHWEIDLGKIETLRAAPSSLKHRANPCVPAKPWLQCQTTQERWRFMHPRPSPWENGFAMSLSQAKTH
jgi:hypothetical protein